MDSITCVASRPNSPPDSTASTAGSTADSTMLALIDNYDSFTYNLVQYFGELGAMAAVIRNDQRSVDDIEALAPRYLAISPGPCTPDEAGVSVAAVTRFAGRIPVLGVCLGHQCIGQAFGARVVRARRLMHGKISRIHHGGEGLFRGLPSPFRATRYHSLALQAASLPACLAVTAWTEDDEIMAIEHRDSATVGVQFHPESLLTEHGHALLRNFLAMGEDFGEESGESNGESSEHKE